jgi:two-component system cell cycle response regulator DivK
MARVLVVEDNPRLHLLALKVLGARGHQVTLAVDGLEAVSVALATHPDVILMDVSLPGLGGLEATRRIKAAMPGMPVAAVTAHAQEADRQRALDAGCDMVLTKPYAIADLLNTVDILVAHSVTPPVRAPQGRPA